MGTLIYKDILVLKKSILYGLAYIVFFMFVLRSSGLYTYTAAIVAFTYILLMNAFAYDDKNKADVMLNSLPVARSKIVLAKYLSIFVFAALGTAAYIILYNAVLILGIKLQVQPVTLDGFAAALIAIGVMNGVYLPLLFKIGYARAKVINMLVFFAAFFGFGLLINKVANSKSDFVLKIQDFMNSQPESVLLLAAFILAFALLASSYAVSVRFYKRRQF